LVERVGEPGSRLVLKLLRIEHVDDWKQVELFERQVTTLAALDHPGIPQLVDRIVEDGRTAGIVETFVEGHTIAQQIAEHGPVSAARFEQILRDCLEVLAYLHRQVPPVLHRDINPRNVMLGRDRAFVIDFGSVRVGGKTDMTSVGTFGYMAPEQIIGRAQAASDMYGLGMTMVSLAERRDVGDLPVDASTGQVDPTALLPSVEPRVREVVLAMIQPGLADRLADPTAALRRLDAKHVPARVASVQAPARRSGPRNPTLVLGAAMAAVLVAGGLGGFFVLRSAPERASLPASEPAPAPAPFPAPALPSELPRPEPEAASEPAPAPMPRPEVVPTTLTDDDSAELVLTSTPSGITARIDGDVECTTPCKLRLAFGKHTIHLDHAGKRVDRDLRVLEDTTLHIALED
jgi:serine/threonine protein kinase